jgi:hypothetical protein
MEDRDDVFVVLEKEKYCACHKCSVTYAKNRDGFAYLLGDEVFVSGRHPKLDGRPLVIIGIFIFEECESGRMIWMKDKETNNPLKIILDTNWLNKINKN